MKEPEFMTWAFASPDPKTIASSDAPASHIRFFKIRFISDPRLFKIPDPGGEETQFPDYSLSSSSFSTQ